jgi:hypothetical protein
MMLTLLILYCVFVFWFDFKFQARLFTALFCCRKWKPPLLTAAMEPRPDISL